MGAPIYLDYNASAPLRPEARAAIVDALGMVGNPSSVHAQGRQARRLVEEARGAVASLLRATPAAVVFTSGGTEANALAIRRSGRRRVLVSAVEHHSVLSAVPDAEVVPVDAHGLVRLDVLAEMLAASDEPALVALMLVNNETGVVQPVAAAAEIAHARGALLHCDAVQAAGRLDVAAEAAGADFIAVSAHKLGGPAGVGALVLGAGISLEPQRGGGQERGRRAGTENLVGIAGFGAAAALAVPDPAEVQRLDALRRRLEEGVRSVCPQAVVHGEAARRAAGTSCIGMPGVSAETQLMSFDLAGVAVSAGAACSSGKVSASHVLRAMGVTEAEARCAVRVSFGWGTEAPDIDRLIAAWADLHRRTGARRVGDAA